LIVIFESIRLVPLYIVHYIPTNDQKTRKASGPKAEVTFGQRANMFLQAFAHILEVVLFVPESSKKVKEPSTRIFALFPERIDELLTQRFKKIVSTYLGGPVLGWRVSNF